MGKGTSSEGTAYAKPELQIVMGSGIGSRSTKVEGRGWGRVQGNDCG